MTGALCNPYDDPGATVAVVSDVMAFAASAVPWPGSEPQYRLCADSICGQRYLLEAVRDLTRNLKERMAERAVSGFREDRPGFMEGAHIDFENETSCILKLMAAHSRFHGEEGFICEDVDRGRAALLDFFAERMAEEKAAPHKRDVQADWATAFERNIDRKEAS